MGLKEVIHIGPYHFQNCKISASFHVDDQRRLSCYSRTADPLFKIEVFLKKKFVNVVSVVGSLAWEKKVAGFVRREIRTPVIVGSIPVFDSAKTVIGSTLQAVIDRVSRREGGEGEVDVVVKIEYEEMMTSDEDVNEDDEEEEETVCAVCAEDLNVGKMTSLVVLPCDHVFHRSCISRWLGISMTCPTCRSSVLPL